MKRLSSHLFVGVLAVSAAALTSGCLFSARARARPVDVYYSTSSEVYVSEPMPAPRVEVVQTVAPSSGMLWVDGYWRWGGARYAWVDGRWARPSQPGYVWYAPRYRAGGGRHVYVQGYWGARGGAGVHRGHSRSSRGGGHEGGHRRGPPSRGVHSR